MKKVFIVHGWSGSAQSDWLPWMKDELSAKNISAEVLQMPIADFPQMDEWVKYLHTKIGTPNEEIFLVGHSLGCMAIMRYVESLAENEKIGGMLLVSGFSHSIGIPYLESFFTSPLDYDKVARSVMQKVFINSDNDPYVPLAEGKVLEEKLGGKLIVLNDVGHINQVSGFVTFTTGLEELLTMMQ
ncbi:MAG: DUF1749 domain-containing protein [Parcubacteria group bacterium]|jgi:hypothetical protein